MPPRTRHQPQLAQLITAARMFLGEAEVAYQKSPRPLTSRLRSAKQVFEFVQQYRPTIGAEQREVFLALALNSKHAVTRVEQIAVGTLASVDVHPREVFRPLLLHAAAAAFLVHNHPSGDPEPSTDDLALTARLREAGQLVGIPILDHLVLGGDGYVSLADRGLM